MKTYKTLLNDFRSLKVREKNSGIAFKKKEGKDLI